MSNAKATEVSSNSSSGKSNPSTENSLLPAIRELKDWIRKGHCVNTQFEIHWTPEELAAMTPEERARCAPEKEAQ